LVGEPSPPSISVTCPCRGRAWIDAAAVSAEISWLARS